jgi:hypothetical protein
MLSGTVCYQATQYNIPEEAFFIAIALIASDLLFVETVVF